MTAARLSPIETRGLFLFFLNYLEVQIDRGLQFILYS
ncbi:Uncharacterised protein [Exiguobacterium aurantiacum]|uniref:Uncharacterized protein n=1 Tax=Exiguobacterium aurantiacum TaxID=33987 RepID=A0A377FRL3_9BACL|nr:Uncharacterised protein [Exiguobacterium aurantiacum]